MTSTQLKCIYCQNFALPSGMCEDCEAGMDNGEPAMISSISGGVKHDQDKPDFSHMTWELMEVHARVRMFGASKYSRDNWHKGFKITRSLAAALRHIFKFLGGEDNDKESGLSHLGHAVCCIEHCLHDHLYRKDNDDRRKP